MSSSGNAAPKHNGKARPDVLIFPPPELCPGRHAPDPDSVCFDRYGVSKFGASTGKAAHVHREATQGISRVYALAWLTR